MSAIATRKRLVPSDDSECVETSDGPSNKQQRTSSSLQDPDLNSAAQNSDAIAVSVSDTNKNSSSIDSTFKDSPNNVTAKVHAAQGRNGKSHVSGYSQRIRRIAHAVAATPKVAYCAETPTDLGGVSDPLASGDSGWSCMDTPSPETLNDGSKHSNAYVGLEEPHEIGTSSSATPVAASKGARPQRRGSSNSVRSQFENWKVGSRYSLQRLLGHGSYGEVALAIDNDKLKEVKRTGVGSQSDAKVAVKRIEKVFDQEIDTKRILREVYILRRLKHVNVIKLLDVVTPVGDSFNEIYLIFEFVDTDLHRLINSPQYLTVEHIKLLRALQYIHSAQVVHRDIKPANILLNESCLLKVCDFGLARVIGTQVQSNEVTEGTSEDQQVQTVKTGSPVETPRKLTRQLTKHVVTRWYRPPELILLQEYTNEVDMWSVGCIFAELLSMQRESVLSFRDRRPLFPGKSCFPLSADNDRTYKDQLDQLNVIFDVIGTPSEDDLVHLGDVQHYLRGLKPKVPTNFAEKYKGAPATAIDLLTKILVFNPRKRISVEEAIEHPFLASVFRREDEEGLLEKVTVEQVTHLDSARLKEKLVEEIRSFPGYSVSSTDEAV